MSSKDKKSDLSDLKSRLGLKKDKKSDEADASGGQATATKSRNKSKKEGAGGDVNDRLAALKKSTLRSKKVEAEPEPQEEDDDAFVLSEAATDDARGQGSPVAGAGQGAPRSHGPPPGAQGPPPTSRPSASQPQRTVQSGTESGGEFDMGAGLADASLSDIDLDGGGMFSLPILVLFGVLFIVGGFFGFVFAESTQSRQIETTRIDDAKSIVGELEERFADLERAQQIIAGLDPYEVDFQAAEELADLDFWVDGGIFPNNRMLLGEEAIRPLTRYIGESNVLTQLIEEHHRMTTGTDREQLEAFAEHGESVEEGYTLGVVVFPEQGLLVLVDEEEEPDEEGQIGVHVIASDAPDRVDHRRVVPVDPTEFYNIETDNAIQRYAKRVERLKYYAEELEDRMELVSETMGRIAESEPSPLLSF